jgi:DNA-binding transcriptional regulator YiaG
MKTENENSVWPWPAEDVEAVTSRARSLFQPPCGAWGTVDWLIREWLSDLGSLDRDTPPRVRNVVSHAKHLSDDELLADMITTWLSAISLVAGRQPLWERQAPSTRVPVVRTPDLAAVSRVRGLAASGQAKEIREHARITVTELASRLGVATSSVSRWERGIGHPRTEVAEAWYRVLTDLTATATVDINAAAA